VKKLHSSQEIRDFIIANVESNPSTITRMAASHFGISRQSVNRYLLNMRSEGLIEAKGERRNMSYSLKSLVDKSFVIKITKGLEEDQVWRQYLYPLATEVKDNVVDICHYGFTEIFNNVIDHSEADNAYIAFERNAKDINMTIMDDGIGIFYKIARDLNLEDERHAILELSKGKLTTDPKNHTGEGIFFTTRMFDKFSILSGKLFFSHIIYEDDWLIESREDDESKGTTVYMKINCESTRLQKEVFQKYETYEDEFGFSRTHVPVRLALYGEENLVSRSQAKRVLARFNRFSEILLDFDQVEFIGQAFADEIFRVFKNSNPNTRIIPLRANANVSTMIERVTKGHGDTQLRLNIEGTTSN